MKQSVKRVLAFTVVAGALLLWPEFVSPVVAQASPQSLPKSPEVLPDGRVTFRLRAPNAQAVTVAWEGAFQSPLAMQKDSGGLWSVTTERLEPDFYGYSHPGRSWNNARSKDTAP